MISRFLVFFVYAHQDDHAGADMWIAATALAHGMSVVTHNKEEFEGVPGLGVMTY